jgi:hypothetical protein
VDGVMTDHPHDLLLAGTLTTFRRRCGKPGCRYPNEMTSVRSYAPTASAQTRTLAGELSAGSATRPRAGEQTRYSVSRISRASRAASDGVLPTFTPAASSASFLAAAVPDEPDTMAPAWPIVLPSGAVKPAT